MKHRQCSNSLPNNPKAGKRMNVLLTPVINTEYGKHHGAPDTNMERSTQCIDPETSWTKGYNP